MCCRRLALAIPALVQLAEAHDQRPGQAEPPGQQLRDLAVPGEALVGQLRQGEQSTGCLQRLPHPEVGGDGERGHELGQADTRAGRLRTARLSGRLG